MPCRDVVWRMALLMALLLLCFSPGAMSDPGDVSLFQVSDELSIGPGERASFEWVAYNDGNTSMLVVPELRSDIPERVTWNLEPGFKVVEPGSGCSFYLNLTADTDMYSGLFDLVMGFNVTDLSTEEYEVIEHQVVLRTVSSYGNLDRVNRIMGIWENFLPEPLDGQWGALGFSVMIWGAIGLLAMKVVGPTIHHLARRTKTKWDDIVIGVVKLPVAMLIIACGTISSLEILRHPPATVADMELGYSIVLVIVASILAYRILVSVIACWGKDRCLNGRVGSRDALANAVALVGKVVIPVAAIFAIAALLGVDLGAAILGIGFLGLIVGYATQNTLSNLFAGLELLFDRPFRPGDRVPMADGHTGQVQKVGLLTTKVLDMDTSEQVIIPNSMIEGQVIVNMNAPDERWKSNVKVNVSDREDPKRIEELMMEASRRTPNILQGNNAPVVRLSRVEGGRMLFTIFIWIDDVANRHIARTEYRSNLYDVFRENGVEFAIPRAQVWLNK